MCYRRTVALHYGRYIERQQCTLFLHSNKDKLQQTHVTRQMCKNIGTRQ